MATNLIRNGSFSSSRKVLENIQLVFWKHY